MAWRQANDRSVTPVGNHSDPGQANTEIDGHVAVPKSGGIGSNTSSRAAKMLEPRACLAAIHEVHNDFNYVGSELVEVSRL